MAEEQKPEKAGDGEVVVYAAPGIGLDSFMTLKSK